MGVVILLIDSNIWLIHFKWLINGQIFVEYFTCTRCVQHLLYCVQHLLYCVQHLHSCVLLQRCLIAVDVTLKYTANVGQFLDIVIIRTNFIMPTTL